MAIFEYEAMDASGEATVGMVEAESESEAVAKIREDYEAVTVLRQRRSLAKKGFVRPYREESGEAIEEKKTALTPTERKRRTITEITVFFWTAVALLVALFLISFLQIVPRVTALYEDFDGMLPLAAQALIAVSAFVQKTWVWFLLIIGLIVLFYLLYRNTEQGKVKLAALRRKLPIYGRLLAAEEADENFPEVAKKTQTLFETVFLVILIVFACGISLAIFLSMFAIYGQLGG